MVITYVQDALSSELKELANCEHEHYERAHQTAYNYTPFYITAQQHGKLIGLVRGYTAYAEVSVDDLLVVAAYRGLGVGTLLLEQLYQQYKNSCFDHINLCAYAFQVPTFYEKCGFELEFIQKNKSNPKLDKYFFIKYFN